MDTVIVRGWSNRIVRFLVAIFVAAAFWWLVAPRLSYPAWIFSVLPAAVFGFLAAFQESRWSAWLVTSLLVGVLVSTTLSQWFPEHMRLTSAERARELVVQTEQIQAAIEAQQIEVEKARNTGTESGSPPLIAPPISIRKQHFTLPLTFRITLGNASRAWHEWLIAALLGLAAAFQSARMTMRASPRE